MSCGRACATALGAGFVGAMAASAVAAGGIIVGILVSITTFAGHLSAERMRTIVLSMEEVSELSACGGLGKYQSARTSIPNSAAPTTTKYLNTSTERPFSHVNDTTGQVPGREIGSGDSCGASASAVKTPQARLLFAHDLCANALLRLS